MNMIPNALQMEIVELKQRLAWIESEITLLSQSHGVTERIQGLKYARAQLIATLSIRKVMDTPDNSN